MAWLYAFAGGVALLVGLLAIPLQIQFRAAMDGPATGLQKGGRVRWAFGLVDLPLGRKPLAGPPGRAKGKPKPRRTRFDHRKLLRSTAFWFRMKHLLRRLLHAIRCHAFLLDVRIGLDDPADTGMLWGLLAPVLANAVPPNMNVMVRPDFDRAAFAFESEGEIRMIPLQVLWLLVSFFASPDTLRVLKPAWRRP